MANYTGSVIDKLFDLYVIQYYHYLLQVSGGDYRTITDRDKKLKRYHMIAHLDGKTTVGTFSGTYFTKFLCFDVDYRDPEMAKWVTYKVTAALDSVGVYDYAVSFSGNKGYHVDIFFDKAISVDSARRFYEFIVKLSDVTSIAGGEVEFRPSGRQGVKLPLGVHQKTGKFCGFCKVNDGLRVMDATESYEYLAAICKTDHTIILGAIMDTDEHTQDTQPAADMENAISRYAPLRSYEQSESYALTHAAERYSVGMTGPGQRHKSFLLLARLMNHNGVEQVDAVRTISEWFAWQDTRFYDSTAEDCEKDLREVIEYIYANDLTLTVEPSDLSVTFSEIDAIIRKCPQKSQKAMAYAMLIHSKRWAGETGSFYMTYTQIAATSGVDERTAKRQIDQLMDLGVVEIVRRNQRKKGTHIKSPNVYRMVLCEKPTAEDRAFFIDGDIGFSDCLTYFYDDKQLRVLFPRRQFKSLFITRGAAT